MIVSDSNEWPDVSGEITLRLADSHADFFARNELVVLVEQDLRPFARYAGWIHAPRAAVADLDLAALAFSSLEHVFRPWITPDRIPIPELELFPRLVAATRPARWLWRELVAVFNEIRFFFR